ncbi:MAG TPA: methylmalonyl-CoA epimerase [Firmicutes bacterium]|nr:methylmalonyl-CoA epimerase [Bacillota bacterium]
MFTLDHLGVVVASLAESVPLYCRLLGLDPAEVEYHDVPTEQVKVAMLKGNTTIELLEPTGSETALARFLEQRGGGFHHWCFAAPPPLEDKLSKLRDAGFTLLDEQPRVGAEGKVFFVHPKSAGGILAEFVEKG